MSGTRTLDPVLTRFRDMVRAAYGDRLDRLVLFGSRARGDHRAESDYDIAVFIRGAGSTWDELGVLSVFIAELLLENAFITAFPFEADRFHDSSHLMGEIRREGIEL